MRQATLMALVVLATLVLVPSLSLSCVTQRMASGETEIDWVATSYHLDLAQTTLNDLAAVSDDDAFIGLALTAAKAVGKASQTMKTWDKLGSSAEDLKVQVNVALDVLLVVTDEYGDASWVTYIILAKTALTEILNYIEQSQAALPSTT